MKHQVKSLAAKAGLGIYRLDWLPFGLSWERDVRGLMGRSGQLTLFDIGANIGQTATSLAGVLPNSRIYSFEPVPSIFARLQQNTAHLAQVECINLALGEKSGEAVITTDRNTCNTMVAGVPSNNHTVTKVSTVDDFCADRGIRQVDLLKTDTEGFETFVLKGASAMLAQGSIDFIVAECDFARRPDGDPHGDFFEIHAMLAPLRFTVVSFYTGGVDERGWIWGNVLMMREGAARGLRVVRPPRH